jgi:hypothetical protein
LRIEAENLADPRGDPKWREEAGRVKATPMELTRCHAADTTRDLVGDGDRQNQLATRDRTPAVASSLRRGKQVHERERRRDRRTAHVHDRLVVRVVVLERLRERRIGERRSRRGDRISSTEHSRRSGRRQRLCCGDRRTSERRLGAGQRETDHVEDAELGGVDNVRGQIFILHLGHPCCELAS